METLINAYSGGQASDELRLELGQLRRVIAQLWLDVSRCSCRPWIKPALAGSPGP